MTNCFAFPRPETAFYCPAILQQGIASYSAYSIGYTADLAESGSKVIVSERAEREMTLSSFESEVFRRVSSSELFQEFEGAFRAATGMPLRFMGSGEDWCIEYGEDGNPFCVALHRLNPHCASCIEANRRFGGELEGADGALTCACFSGLGSSAAPVKLGNTTIGYLKTAHVLRESPTEEKFEKVIDRLDGEARFSEEERASLREAYFQSREMDPGKLDGIATLLEMFAGHLSAHAEKVALAIGGNEPPGISRAIVAIHRGFQDVLSLEQLAAVANMSTSHFCRTFKDHTSLTVVEYITRVRVYWAREQLLRGARRISEIAYDAGFQSLSQFNRAFARVTGTTPSAYRKAELEKAVG